MTFGFPAYHRERIRLPADEDVMQRTASAVEAIGWRVLQRQADRITARAGLGLRSWGETVVIERVDDGIEVQSRCRLVTQCFDWGKNRRNVQRLRDELKR